MDDLSNALLPQISDALARHVAAVAGALVTVHGRRGPPFSGFALRPGVIVTAEEALESDEDIAVGLPDGRQIAATLAGRDPSTDIAVLRIEATEALQSAPFAGAADLAAGHLALAVGRRAEGVSAQLGMLSLAGPAWRSMRGGRIDRALRVDRRLDPALEGGLLIDARTGQPFAMAVSGPRRATLGIPAATIERVAERLLAHGRIGRGYVGLGLQPVRLDAAAAGAAGLAEPRGLMVVGVDTDGPGARAGVLQGDLLVAWDGEPLRRVRDVSVRLDAESVGQSATLSLIRAGQPLSIQLTVGERPARGAE